MKWLLLILSQLFLLALGGYFLVLHPGKIIFQWLGYQVELSILVFVTLLILTSVIVTFLLKFFGMILGIPTFWRVRYQAYAYQHGMVALVKSFSSVIAHDGKKTEQHAQALRKFLNEHPLATYFEAEAALQQREFPRAETLYLSLIHIEPFQFLACAGLIHLSLILADAEKALRWAKQAKKLYPTSPWVREVIIDQTLKLNKPALALAEIEDLMRLNLLSNINLKITKSQILLKLATELQAHGDLKSALNYIEEAFHLTPDNSDLGLLYAKLLSQLNHLKAAQQVIEHTWSMTPDSRLVALYLDVTHPTSELEKFQMIQRLASFAPHHPESFLISSKAAIEAQIWITAREHLTFLIKQGYKPNEVYNLMAELELAEHHNVMAANNWRQKAISSNSTSDF